MTVEPENIKAILATQFNDFGKGELMHRSWRRVLLYPVPSNRSFWVMEFLPWMGLCGKNLVRYSVLNFTSNEFPIWWLSRSIFRKCFRFYLKMPEPLTFQISGIASPWTRVRSICLEKVLALFSIPRLFMVKPLYINVRSHSPKLSIMCNIFNSSGFVSILCFGFTILQSSQTLWTFSINLSSPS